MPRAGEALLAIEGVGKRFDALSALDDVSLEIGAGEIHGLLGENGAGKSTLCNIVFGVHQADAGAMRLAGVPFQPSGPAQALQAGVAMVHQHFSLVSDLSVVDNLLLGQARGVLRRREFAARVVQLSEEFGLAVRPEALVQDLSVGERQRVEIVKCLMRRPRLLVLDEPTAVLLPDEIEGLLQVCERVARSGCGIVLVTHKLAEIRRTAHRVTVLRLGRVVARSETPASDIDMLVRAMIQRDLQSTGAAVRAAVGDVAGAASPATTTGELAAGSAAIDRPARAAGEVRVDQASAPPPPVLRVERLGLRDADGVRRLDAIDFTVGRGEIVGIAGVEGNGQSELVAVLSGMIAANEGGFSLERHAMTNLPPKALTAAGIGVVPEDRHREGCVPGLSLALNLAMNQLTRFTRFGLLDRAALAREAKTRMQAFDVRAAGVDVLFSALSGGNQQKAVLARELSLPGLKLLVAAQPTRGLDVGAVEAIYAQIRLAARRGVAVLLASSELDELLAVADRLLVMYRGRVMGECIARPESRARIGAWMAGHAP
ncbi:MAG TPA: ABC transporter ATP-binding protein [Caldimonas sp.]|jgi:simple sugar transport system ATP-binding protein|nr:ABC transporter ATP-binding protein [Caldimonas sp.]HEX4235630.1 ABC transporter ATP-binding protein [Caldimonas sp.]